MKIEFTKKELYLIERTIDRLTSEHLKGIFQYMDTTKGLDVELNEKARQMIDRNFDSWLEAYDLMRSVSVKCEAIRLGDKEPDKAIRITVKGGIVQEVEGLPPGHDYEVVDLDSESHQ